MSRREYSKKEAALLLGVTPSAIQRRIERKTIEARKDNRGHWLVSLTDEEIERKRMRKADRIVEQAVTDTDPQSSPAADASPGVPEGKKGFCIKESGIVEALLSGEFISQAIDFVLEWKDRAEELTRSLAEKGGLHIEDADSLVDSFMDKFEEQKNIYLIKLMEGVEAVRSKIVTRQDVEQLEKKIEILSKKIQALKEKENG
ncbi:MAG: hypothetical protein GX364_02110 [Firmicutes bacterium]|jgi:polyhydroxyalkanoate synthesis regulator phasin|nr:hypothetical protein [Bacillota bacterium]